MTALPIPSYCSRFGIAVLLVALADFLFYGQPAGINFLLFAILIAGAIVAVHPSAFSDARLWLKPAALLVALLPLVENVSPLSVSIALVALAVFALSLAGRLRSSLARIAGQLSVFLLSAPFRLIRDFFRWRKAARRLGRRRIRLRGHRRLDHAAGARRRVPGAVRRRQPGHRILAVADRPARAARHDPDGAAHLLDARAGAGVWAFLRPRLPRIPAPHAAFGADRCRPVGPRRRQRPSPGIEDMRLRQGRDPARADRVQHAVCGADRARRRLSLGRRRPARGHDLRRLCASRRLSADRHGAACRRLRAGGAAAGQRHLRRSADPPPGLCSGWRRTSRW